VQQSDLHWLVCLERDREQALSVQLCGGDKLPNLDVLVQLGAQAALVDAAIQRGSRQFLAGQFFVGRVDSVMQAVEGEGEANGA
jgi:hypothetical protein